MKCTECNKEIDDDSKFCIYCGSPQQIEKISYTQGLLEPFKKNGKWGYRDIKTMSIIVPPKYSKANSFFEKRAVVAIGNKYSVVDQNGKELIPFNYDFIDNFEVGYAICKRGDKWSTININCILLMQFKYDNLLRVNKTHLIAQLGEKSILIDCEHNILTQDRQYDRIIEFTDKLIFVKNNFKYGLINNRGEEIIPCEYDNIYLSEDRLISIQKKQKYGLINENGDILLPCNYETIQKIDSQFTKVYSERNIGLLFNGKLIIPAIFKKIDIINPNLILAKQKREWHSYNNNGIETTETTSDFIQERKRDKYLFMCFLILTIVIILFSLFL